MSEHRAKAAAISALLKNKETASKIFEAARSPYGSTKNKTAARILRSVGRAAANKFGDGQGGTFSQPSLSVNQRLPINFNPKTGSAAVNILPSAQKTVPASVPSVVQPSGPQLNDQFAPAGAMNDNGTISPGAPAYATSLARSIDEFVPGLSGSSAPASSATPPSSPDQTAQAAPAPAAGPLLAPQPAYAAEVGRNGEFSQGEVDQMFLTCVRTGRGAGDCANDVKGQTGKMVSWLTARDWAHRDKTKDASLGYGQPSGESGSSTTTTTTTTETGGPSAESGTEQAPAPGTDQGQTDSSGLFHAYGTTDIQRMLQDALNSGDSKAIDDWFSEFQKQDPAGAEAFRPIYNAYKSGTGVSGAELAIYSNPDQLEKTLGIPKEVLDKMPWDILGGPKLDDLRTLARKATGLDQMESQLMNRQTSHLYADQNFRNYVLGKDEYLKKVDTMLHDYDSYLQTVDLSNPGTRQRMMNYRNYLVTLKGSLQQKYINLVNQSSKEESADYQRFETMYKAKAAETASLEKALVSNATTSWQKTVPLLNDAIKSMYSVIEKQRTAAMDKFKANVSAMQTAQKMINDGILAKSQNDKIQAETALAEHKAGAPYSTAKTTAPDGTTYKKFSETTAKTLFYNTPPTSSNPGSIKIMSPNDIYNTAESNPDGPADPMFVARSYLNKLQTSLISDVSQGDFSTVAKAVAALGNLDSVPEASRQAITDAYTKAIQDSVPEGIGEYLLNDAENKAFKTSMNDLFKGKTFWGVPITRDSFISRNSGTLAKPVLGLLWDLNEFGGGTANGAPFGYTAQEWSDALNGNAQGLIDDLKIGMKQFLAQNPSYQFS